MKTVPSQIIISFLLLLSQPLVSMSMAADTDPTTRIAVVACFFNAGVTTTGLQLAKAVAKQAPDAQIRFFSWQDAGQDDSTYESIVRKAGFEVTKYGEPLDRAQWNELLEDEHSGRGLKDKEFLKTQIRECTNVLKEYRPRVIIHGLVPDAAVASQLLGISNVQYGPIPMDLEYMRKHMIKDIPDAQSTWFTRRLLPRVLRQWLVQWMLQQQLKPSLLSQAAIECGWRPEQDENGSTTPSGLNVFACATHYLVADLPSNYNLADLPSNTKVIGPVFADNEMAGKLPFNVERFLEGSFDDEKPKVFVNMGSSGDKESLVEAVKAVCNGEFHAIVALPSCRCTTAELRNAIGESEMTIPESSVVITDKFVPARQLASWADVLVGHGGRGTKQTAMASGTPMVGVGLQFEQEFNLENAVRAGAAIRLPKHQWKANHIREAIRRVVKDESFQKNAKAVAKEMASYDSRSEKEAARLVLQTLAVSRK